MVCAEDSNARLSLLSSFFFLSLFLTARFFIDGLPRKTETVSALLAYSTPYGGRSMYILACPIQIRSSVRLGHAREGMEGMLEARTG